METKQRLGTWFVGIFSVLIGFFSPIQLLLYAIVTVVLVDTITALLRDWSKIYRKKFPYGRRIILYFQCIKSSGLRRTVLKLFLYCIGLMGFYLAEVSIFTVTIYISNMIGAIILMTELKSICENIDIVLGTDIFTTMFKLFRNKTLKKLDNKMNEKETKYEDINDCLSDNNQ